MQNNDAFLQLPFEFDIKKLVSDLELVHSDEWVPHPNTQAYEGSWTVSSLSSTTGDMKQIVAAENQEYFDTPLFHKTDYIKEVINTFKTKIEAVRFMRLGAGSVIKEHCDHGSCFEEGYARLHIPITTNDNVTFILNGEPHTMKAGCCYYIDAHNPHSVVNEGTCDRVHLLIDCHVNAWLKAIFLQHGFKEPYYKYGSKGITDENVEAVIASLKSIGSDSALDIAKELQHKVLHV